MASRVKRLKPSTLKGSPYSVVMTQIWLRDFASCAFRKSRLLPFLRRHRSYASCTSRRHPPVARSQMSVDTSGTYVEHEHTTSALLRTNCYHAGEGRGAGHLERRKLFASSAARRQQPWQGAWPRRPRSPLGASRHDGQARSGLVRSRMTRKLALISCTIN